MVRIPVGDPDPEDDLGEPVTAPWLSTMDGATGATVPDDLWPGDGTCSCESYDCRGECCGIGNCSCTPTEGDDTP